jgi:hypothetical protein
MHYLKLRFDHFLSEVANIIIYASLPNLDYIIFYHVRNSAAFYLIIFLQFITV